MFNDTKVIYQRLLTIGKSKEQNEGDINISLEIHQEADTREAETIDHKTIKGYKTLSMSGDIWLRNRKDITIGGQIHDTLSNKNIYRELFISEEDLKTIIYIWKRWHLNNLKPNCIHQEAFNCNENFTERAKQETDKCPQGYKYGSKWLVEPLPEEVIEQIISIFNKYSK